MQIEITDYPGRSYCSIKIPSLRFIGLLDRSADKHFGIASGGIMPTCKRVALYWNNGEIAWMINDCVPMDICFADDGWGGFVNSSNIYAFNKNGVVFDVEIPIGIGKVCSVSRDDHRIIFLSDRYKITYDISGLLLMKERL